MSATQASAASDLELLRGDNSKVVDGVGLGGSSAFLQTLVKASGADEAALFMQAKKAGYFTKAAFSGLTIWSKRYVWGTLYNVEDLQLLATCEGKIFALKQEKQFTRATNSDVVDALKAKFGEPKGVVETIVGTDDHEIYLFGGTSPPILNTWSFNMEAGDRRYTEELEPTGRLPEGLTVKVIPGWRTKAYVYLVSDPLRSDAAECARGAHAADRAAVRRSVSF